MIETRRNIRRRFVTRKSPEGETGGLTVADVYLKNGTRKLVFLYFAVDRRWTGRLISLPYRTASIEKFLAIPLFSFGLSRTRRSQREFRFFRDAIKKKKEKRSCTLIRRRIVILSRMNRARCVCPCRVDKPRSNAARDAQRPRETSTLRATQRARRRGCATKDDEKKNAIKLTERALRADVYLRNRTRKLVSLPWPPPRPPVRYSRYFWGCA